MNGTRKFYAFKRFERFWHWSQAALIIFMIFSGLEIHGLYQVLGFALAIDLHTTAAWALMVFWLLVLFWHMTTGEWRHYVPTRKSFVAMMMFYAVGILSGSAHPFQPSETAKHNPIQRLTYLALTIGLMPVIWVTGLLLYFYNIWPEWGIVNLVFGWVAGLHTLLAFIIMSFLVLHVYLITTGVTLTSQLRAMITGWDDIHVEENVNEDTDKA